MTLVSCHMHKPHSGPHAFQNSPTVLYDPFSQCGITPQLTAASHHHHHRPHQRHRQHVTTSHAAPLLQAACRLHPSPCQRSPAAIKEYGVIESGDRAPRCRTKIRLPSSFKRCCRRFLSNCFIIFLRCIHHFSSLQRNLDGSTLTKEEMIDLLQKSDAITSVSDGPSEEEPKVSSDAPQEERPEAGETAASTAEVSTLAVAASADSKEHVSLPSSSAAVPVAAHVDSTTGEPIRTLYVGACPSSLSERELYQVFNRFVGYESSYLYHMNGKVSAFVTFTSSEFATYAVAFCKQHGGFPLDPFLILVLDVQLANQNSNRKRRQDQYYPAEVGYSYSSARPVSSDSYGYASGSSYYGGYGAAAPAQSSGYENYTQVADLASASAAYSSGKSSSRMPPSATLFISYITDETTVEDLRAVFGQMVGFRAARKTTMRGAPCAFIEFDNDRNSTVAMNIMQGQCLRPTDRGGLRIEYAKPTLNPTKTASAVPPPVNTGAYAGSYAPGPGRW